MRTEDFIRAAEQADQLGQLHRAELLALQAIRTDPHNVEARLILGSIKARVGPLIEAERWLREALIIDPNAYDAARWLATLLIGKRGGTDALEFARVATQLRPDLAEAHVVLGLAAIGAGDASQAIASFQRAIELNPQMAGAYHNLGVALQRDDSYEEAIEAFQRALELSPQVLETYLHLGRAYLAADRADDAMDCAHTARALSPNSVSVFRLLGEASLIAIHGERGEEHIRKAIELNPGSGLAHALLASRLQEKGEFASAEESVSRSIELQPKQGLAYYVLSHNRKMAEGDRQLFESVENEIDLAPSESRYLHFALGKAFDDLKQFERAIKHFDLANRESDASDGGSEPRSADKYVSKVHRFMQLFTQDFLERYPDVGITDAAPIFIVGMPRSGTTLLEQILSRHPQVGAAGEQSYWRDHVRPIVDLKDRNLNVEGLQAAGHKYMDVLRSVSPGYPHVTDKWPSNYLYLGILHLLFPNAIFLHARRHPIDTSLSIYMRPFFRVSQLGRSRQQIVDTYKVYREIMEHWKQTLPPGRIFDVTYEEMVRDQEGVTSDVLEFCGLPWDDACLNPEAGDRRVITFSKWQVRQPVYKTSVARWRNYEPWLGEFRDLLSLA